MSSSHPAPARRLIAAVAMTLTPMAVAIGQSSVAISPFVSYVPSATQNPLAGLALTFGGTTGLALRASADISVSNPDKTNTPTSTGGFRPWGADADAVLFLGGLGGGATVFSRTLSPYLFSGLGVTGGDSSGVNVVHNGWSYGAGAAIPLGLDADLFGEARWRMSQYVLPTAHDAPSSKSELRFGLSFHVGGGSSDPGPASPRRRQRMDSYDDEEAVAVQSAPAPIIVQQPAPIIVQQPAPVIIQQPAPVIIQQAPVIVQPEPSNVINVNLPGSVVYSGRRSRGNSVTVVRTVPSRVIDGIVYRRRDRRRD